MNEPQVSWTQDSDGCIRGFLSDTRVGIKGPVFPVQREFKETMHLWGAGKRKSLAEGA